jgi:hypothetical protein
MGQRNIRRMQKQRVLVGVVGFSDVERHALNTVFRLSEERDLSYGPWTPPTAADPKSALAPPQVMLVDGTSAEAVLSHARQLPRGQWLIWVGPDAPEHAWRVLERPIQWVNILHDLDAVFAVHQADSGLLDLDITSPANLHEDPSAAGAPPKRAILVGVTDDEAAVLRNSLSLAGVEEVDTASTTNDTIDLLGRNLYRCGVFNLDDQHIDPWTLMALFRRRNRDALPVAISELAGPLAGWWSRRRTRRNAERLGIAALLARPLQPEELSKWMDRL